MDESLKYPLHRNKIKCNKSVCERIGRVSISQQVALLQREQEVNSSLDRINRNSVMFRLMDVAVTLVSLSEQPRKPMSNFK